MEKLFQQCMKFKGSFYSFLFPTQMVFSLIIFVLLVFYLEYLCIALYVVLCVSLRKPHWSNIERCCCYNRSTFARKWRSVNRVRVGNMFRNNLKGEYERVSICFFVQ